MSRWKLPLLVSFLSVFADLLICSLWLAFKVEEHSTVKTSFLRNFFFDVGGERIFPFTFIH